MWAVPHCVMHPTPCLQVEEGQRRKELWSAMQKWVWVASMPPSMGLCCVRPFLELRCPGNQPSVHHPTSTPHLVPKRWDGLAPCACYARSDLAVRAPCL